MRTKVLIVDDRKDNVAALQALLDKASYELLCITDSLAVIETIRTYKPSVVLMDVLMPNKNGIELCKEIRADSDISDTLVVLVTAVSNPELRVKGLEAGANDFITKPIDSKILMARLRALSRLHLLVHGLKRNIPESYFTPNIKKINTCQSYIAITGCDELQQEEITNIMATLRAQVKFCQDHDAISALLDTETVAAIVLYINQKQEINSIAPLLALTQNTSPLITILDDIDLIPLCLDLGANDYVVWPLDSNELLARVATQIRYKKYIDMLTMLRDAAVRLSHSDPLTHARNRRYLRADLEHLFSANIQTRALSIIMLDIDRFKEINDRLGHITGDQALKKIVSIIKNLLPNEDSYVVRYGGEELLVVLNESNIEVVYSIAEQMRNAIEISDIVCNAQVTVSVGVASMQESDKKGEDIIHRADMALYRAKNEGRNRVRADY